MPEMFVLVCFCVVGFGVGSHVGPFSFQLEHFGWPHVGLIAGFVGPLSLCWAGARRRITISAAKTNPNSDRPSPAALPAS